MKKTEQKRVDPHSHVRHRKKNYAVSMPLFNMRKTNRNAPCPCGREKIITDQRGQEFKRPMKFKYCCLDK